MAVKNDCKPETLIRRGKRFILGDVLDKTGDFGVFYKCTEEKTGKEFLLKKETINSSGYWRDPDVWSQFGHLNILRYDDSWVTQQANQELLYILCETAHMSLENLLFSISPQRTPCQLFPKWLFHIASALEYMHHRNNEVKPVLHRNLRPSSIMVSSDCILKVFGFGLSKRLDNQDAVAKTVFGRDLFQCPEIRRGRLYDKSSDMWSLGVTSAYIANYKEAKNARTSDQIISLLTASGQERAVIELVVESLEVNPTHRITAAQLANKLSKIYGASIQEPPDKSTCSDVLRQRMSQIDKVNSSRIAGDPPSSVIRTASVFTQTGQSLYQQKKVVVTNDSVTESIECPELLKIIEIHRRLIDMLGDELYCQAFDERLQKEQLVKKGINYRDVMEELKLLKSVEANLHVAGRQPEQKYSRQGTRPRPSTREPTHCVEAVVPADRTDATGSSQNIQPIKSLEKQEKNKNLIKITDKILQQDIKPPGERISQQRRNRQQKNIQQQMPHIAGLGPEVLKALEPILVNIKRTSTDPDAESGLGESM